MADKATAMAWETASDPFALPAGTYYRPTSDEVSGVPGASAKFARGPCPALNTLANLGFINRSGKNVELRALRRAVHSVFPLSKTFVWALSASKPAQFDLSALCQRDLGEHDVSLLREDAAFQPDQSQLHAGLVQQLDAACQDKTRLSRSDLVQFHGARLRDSKARNKAFEFTSGQQIAAHGEIALILSIFGDGTSAPCSDLRTFLVEERLPTGYARPKRSLSTLGVLGRVLRVGKEAKRLNSTGSP
ncbi:hypothetical protein ATCC90586_004975 [Pythium insidiosum]|nr:hypothetical protein ATCC90586_004975 [Pythium insidiosum]